MYSSGEPRHDANPRENRWIKEKKEILDFIESHDITSHQLEIAYQLAMGVSEDDEDVKSLLSEDVRVLAKLIDDHTASGLPLTEIATMLGRRRELDVSKEDFKKWLTELDITENERKLLAGIVENRRIGTLQFVDKNTGNDIFHFQIPEDVDVPSSTPVWAYNFKRLLEDAIAKSNNGKIEIWFEAKS